MKLQVGNFDISYVSNDFKKWFGEPEIKLSSVKLYTKVLEKSMNDKEISKTFNPSEITLDELVSQFENWSKDKWYITYVRDTADVLRAVYVSWSGGGWVVDAYSVTDSLEWRAGSQVVSRKEFDTPTSDTLTLNHSDTYQDEVARKSKTVERLVTWSEFEEFKKKVESVIKI